MLRFVLPAVAGIVALAALASCHPAAQSTSPVPGGPSATPSPAPTATPPGLLSVSALGFASAGGGHGGGQCPAGSAATGCTSVYALTSDPAGITVTRSDPSGQTAQANATMTTPIGDTLPASSTNLQYAFASGSATPFVVAVQQIHDGPHQVYYNRAADSTGTTDASALQSAQRSTRALALNQSASVNELHRTRAAHAVSSVLGDRVYVRFRAASLQHAARTVSEAIRSLGTAGAELTTAKADPLAVVTVPANVDAAAFMRSLASRNDVAAVYPVHARRTLARTATVANDPHAILPDQWYLTTAGFPFAWSYAKGAGATIAVIDTGVDLTNADLAVQVSFSESVIGGKTSSTQTDPDGHGTNIAGVADAATGNALGFAGGGYSARLIAIGVQSPSGLIAASDEAIAITDAVSHGADVVNLSFGSEAHFNGADGYDEGEYEAIEAAIQAGTTIVAAAGNNRDGGDPAGDGFKHFDLDYPAAYAGVISAGASKLVDAGSANYAAATEAVASYSQAGVGLSVVAPGGEAAPVPGGGADPDLLHWIWNYYSTTAAQPCTYAHGSLPQTPTNCTALFNGTSQAAAQVSAAVALLYSAAGGHRSLTPAQVAQLIQDTADNIGDPYQGHGRLNAYRAIAALVQDPGATATGPKPVAHSAAQTIAFAYKNSGANRPVILDYDFPLGVPVDATTGTFRIADVRPQDATTYRVAVWYDANGDGVIDAGDSIAVSAATCSVTAPCAIGTLRPVPVTGAYALP